MATVQGLMHDPLSLKASGRHLQQRRYTCMRVRTVAVSLPRPARASAPLAEPFSSALSERMKGDLSVGWPGMMRHMECSRCIIVFFFEGSPADFRCCPEFSCVEILHLREPAERHRAFVRTRGREGRSRVGE